jgi:hypothetical protein
MRAGPQAPREAGGAADAIADPDLPARPGQLGQGGAGRQRRLRVGRPRRPPRHPPAAGGRQVQQPAGQPGPRAWSAGQGVGGVGGAGQPPAGGGAGQHLHGGGLAGGELTGGTEDGSEGVDPVLGPQRRTGPGGQPQLPTRHHQVICWWGRVVEVGAGLGAGPAGLHGPLDQPGGDGARHPQPDVHPCGGPGELEADMRSGVEGAAQAQQPGQVPPQGLGRGRLDLGWRQDLDEAGVGGQPPLPPAPPAPPGHHHPRHQGDGHRQEPQPPPRRHRGRLLGQVGEAGPRVDQEPLQPPPGRPVWPGADSHRQPRRTSRWSTTARRVGTGSRVGQ